MRNLHDHIAALAAERPHEVTLAACDGAGEVTREITYRELSQMVEEAAGALTRLGLSPGDRVALAFRTSPEFLSVSWAAWALGIATVPLDMKRDTPELYRFKVEASAAKLVLYESGVSFPALEGVEAYAYAPGPRYEGAWAPDCSHTALILFTSGTTARPKGAILTLENLETNASDIAGWLRIGADDRFLVQLPLHHINSITFCLATLLAGGSVALPPGYSNSGFWAQVAGSGATLSSVVPSIVYDQLARREEYTARKGAIALNRIQIGSAPVVASAVQEFIRAYGIPLYQGYGQTETALRVTGVPMDLSEELYDRLVEENSIGAPMPWADLAILDEAGARVEEGREGELAVRGRALMAGYVGGEPAFRDGYFLTGDIGLYRLIEGRRFFFLTGRKKELIIKGGVNISPVAVENRLLGLCPEVAQAYAVPVADGRYGEDVGAVVCVKEGADREKTLRRLKLALLPPGGAALYETPRYFALREAADLPHTSTGKVQRTALKEQIAARAWDSLYRLHSGAYRFEMLHPQSPYLDASFALHTRCWGPLAPSRGDYLRTLSLEHTILAIDPADALAGQISFIRTNLSEEALSRTPYAGLFSPAVLNADGAFAVCVSICSARYAAKPVPSVARAPSPEEVRAYLTHDPVYAFHARAKGGAQGAHLTGLIPQGRPEDASSLGYTMLLKYPELTEHAGVDDGAPVSDQLIEAVLMLASDLHLEGVYAYSRPGGLAAYLAAHELAVDKSKV